MVKAIFAVLPYSNRIERGLFGLGGGTLAGYSDSRLIFDAGLACFDQPSQNITISTTSIEYVDR